MRAKRTTLAITILLLFALSFIGASAISFSGGHTSVSMQDGSRSVSLSGGAVVTTDTFSIKSDRINIYGDNYSYVSCEGNVNASEPERGLSFQSPNLFYDRNAGKVRSDSWIEIQDTKNQAALSCAWFEYSMETQTMKLQLMAKIIKVTDQGLMVCRADSIEYRGKENTVTLKGNANVTWNGDTYKAAIIMVDLNTNDIRLYGTVSGEFNG